MNIKMSAIHLDLTDSMKAKITSAIEKIARLSNGGSSANVSCTEERQGFKVNVEFTNGNDTFRATETSRNFYQALKSAANKVEQQIIKANGKFAKKGNASVGATIDDKEPYDIEDVAYASGNED